MDSINNTEYKAAVWDTLRKAYWRPDAEGYTEALKEAGLFTLKEIAERNSALSCRSLVPVVPFHLRGPVGG